MEEKKEEIRAKPLLNFSFMQEETIPQQIYNHSFFNNYSMLQMSHSSFSPAPLHNFFSFCRSRSHNDDEYKESKLLQNEGHISNNAQITNYDYKQICDQCHDDGQANLF